MDVNEVVDDAECLDQLCLGANGVFWCRWEDVEASLVDTKKAFNDIACLSMSKIEQLLLIAWPEARSDKYCVKDGATHL